MKYNKELFFAVIFITACLLGEIQCIARDINILKHLIKKIKKHSLKSKTLAGEDKGESPYCKTICLMNDKMNSQHQEELYSYTNRDYLLEIIKQKTEKDKGPCTCLGCPICANGKCDRTTKNCECNAGWEGKLCDKKNCHSTCKTCEKPLDSNSCLSCKTDSEKNFFLKETQCIGCPVCQNGGSCVRATAKCKCTYAHSGDNCEKNKPLVITVVKADNLEDTELGAEEWYIKSRIGGRSWKQSGESSSGDFKWQYTSDGSPNEYVYFEAWEADNQYDDYLGKAKYYLGNVYGNGKVDGSMDFDKGGKLYFRISE